MAVNAAAGAPAWPAGHMPPRHNPTRPRHLVGQPLCDGCKVMFQFASIATPPKHPHPPHTCLPFLVCLLALLLLAAAVSAVRPPHAVGAGGPPHECLGLNLDAGHLDSGQPGGLCWTLAAAAAGLFAAAVACFLACFVGCFQACCVRCIVSGF
jgi:hypothetical protein